MDLHMCQAHLPSDIGLVSYLAVLWDGLSVVERLKDGYIQIS